MSISIETLAVAKKYTGGTSSSVELDTSLSIQGKAADAKATGEAICELSSENALLKKNITDIELDYYDVDIASTELKPFGDFTLDHNTISPSFCGCALPIKSLKGKLSIKIQSHSAEDSVVYAYISEIIPSKISDIKPIATASSNITITHNTIVMEFDNEINLKQGYLVVYSVGRAHTMDLRNYVNSDVLDTTKSAYYIDKLGTFKDMGEGNFARWGVIINSISCVSTEKQPNTDRKIEDAIDKKVTKINYIYVATIGSDETGNGTEENPYATIYHANEVIVDNNEHNRYIIKVADGIYTDLQEKYAGAYSGSFEGVNTKDYVEYIGNIENPENVIIQWDGLTGFDAETFVQAMGNDKCPFHITGSHVSSTGGMHTAIRGFTIDAKNIRYALHIETSGCGKNVDWEVSDCVFKWHGTPNMTDKTYQTPTIGTGSGHFEKGKFLRCKIVNDAEITDGFRNHDSQYRYGDKYTVHEGAEITFESCVFNGGASGNTNIRFRNIYSDNLVDGYNRFNIINCKGINKLDYQLSGNATTCDWRANIRCSDIVNNVFLAENLMQ